MTIFDLFDGLERCAPGEGAAVARVAAGLPAGATVLDAGCGRGADLPALLAAVPGARITAIDMAAPFIAHVGTAFPQVRAVAGDMLAPPGGPYDLIWSGGAVYTVGVAAALAAWRGLLAPGGRVAFSDLVLRRLPPAPEVAAFLSAEGVPIRDEAGLRAEIAAAGWQVTDLFWLPPSAWAAYYGPIEPRLTAPVADAAAEALFAAFRDEIALWHRHGADYGYAVAVAVQA